MNTNEVPGKMQTALSNLPPIDATHNSLSATNPLHNSLPVKNPTQNNSQPTNATHNSLLACQRELKDAKAKIYALESSVLSRSVAHQKERDGLIKELNANKVLAIKNLQRDHELQIERTKLQLEKNIESLKLEIFHKDNQIVKLVKESQESKQKNEILSRKVEDNEKIIAEQENAMSELREVLELLYQEKDELEDKSKTLPSITEYEYLKNIVYQFMIGKEPLVLSKVISALFKFDDHERERISKFQDTLQAKVSTNSRV